MGPACGQLNRENNIPLSPCVPENLVSRDEFSRPIPRQPALLYTQAESGAYLRDSSRVPRRRPFMEPPYATGSVPSLSGPIAYRSRSLPRVRRHKATKPQGSFERVLPWQVTMDQLIFASLSQSGSARHGGPTCPSSARLFSTARLPSVLTNEPTSFLPFSARTPINIVNRYRVKSVPNLSGHAVAYR